MTQCKCILNRRAHFNLPNETTGKWCGKCPDKPKEAIDVKNKRCECGKSQPILNLPGQTKGRWCTKCPDKPKEAINVNHKRCECGKSQPSLNLPGQTKGRWCSKCPDKPKEAIDVKNKRCECGKAIPSLNLPGQTKGRWCAKCPDKPKEAIDVKNKRCKQCNLIHVKKNKYRGHCVRCFIYLFPDEPVTKNYKVKEKHVFDAVIKLLPDGLTAPRDKRVGGCSKRRPDLMIDVGSHWICAENDENGHSDYDNSCENKRTMELYTDMGNRPMILIRFNCDKYTSNGVKYDSLFKLDSRTGISIVRSKKDFDERITAFVKLINHYIESEPPEKAITTEYLYYDDADVDDVDDVDDADDAEDTEDVEDVEDVEDSDGHD